VNFERLSLATALATAVLSPPATAQDAEFQRRDQCITSAKMAGMDHGAMGYGDAMKDGMDPDLSASPMHVQ
jgi:uncharacterized protein involved in copper resistance